MTRPMPLSWSVPTPLEYFGSLVASDESLPLLEAMSSLAQDEHPELDVQQVLGDMDQLQARLKRRLAADAGSLQRLAVLNQFFFQDLGFAGNVNNYYDPDNSYLHVVLRTRRGIPITLAVLWLELARSIRLDAQGVGFPGHFLVTLRLPEGQVVMDPFTGESLGREELSERLEPFQRSMGLSPDQALIQALQVVAPRDILARALRNLKEIHRSQQDAVRQLAVQDRLVVLLPQAWSEWRDRGLVRAELGQTDGARADLRCYLEACPDAFDHVDIRQRLTALGG